MLAPTLADLLALVRAAHHQIQSGAQAPQAQSGKRRQARLYLIDPSEASAS
jgi:hypothetical protein